MIGVVAGLIAIQFDEQPPRRAEELAEVRADGRLSPEAHAIKFTSLEAEPEADFGGRHDAAHGAREVFIDGRDGPVGHLPRLHHLLTRLPRGFDDSR